MTRFLARLSHVLAAIACVALVCVMLVTFVDVIGRYFFSAPLTFAVELIQLGVGITVLCGLAVTTLDKGHIAVDLAEQIVPRVVVRLLSAIAAVCGFVFIALVAWQLWNRAVDFRGQGLATDILFLPVWPVVMVMSVAAGLAALVALVQIVRRDFGGAPDTISEYD